mmetsp:Transcript_22090/g.48035  ORF Transcript_22090/g.48035 Transcript_22090/m.48035 type:complete len:228 (+) Transcript_22090:2488-3171(+)
MCRPNGIIQLFPPSLLVHVGPIDQSLARVGMQPSLLSHGPYLCPDMVGEVQDVSCVEAKGAAVGAKEVGKLATSTSATFEEGARRVEAREGIFGVAQFTSVNFDSTSPARFLLLCLGTPHALAFHLFAIFISFAICIGAWRLIAPYHDLLLEIESESLQKQIISFPIGIVILEARSLVLDIVIFARITILRFIVRGTPVQIRSPLGFRLAYKFGNQFLQGDGGADFS